ncbi:hypothetical protein [uncultured Sunxiuqinia sp.]|uniref:hypothetical protein n=1 Tax=uncultured Sunxiuqinia sp. TaxID=1573825 RepID=UPI0026356FDF|nr:hypothetical protein [uncultured Sunxiuqinia sp.]
MENLIEILKYIGPFIGVFIGWLLTRKNENDKIKYSEIRQIKRSLYVLLEIRNQITISKRMDKYLGILVEKLNLMFKEYTEEEIEAEQFKGLFKQILPSLIGENFQKDLKEQFEKCIDNLSEIDPILTYRINGKQNIHDYIQSWEQESKCYFELESVEDIQNIIEHFKPKLVDELKSDIESIIIDIAHLISKEEAENVKDIIAEPEDLEIEIDIEGYLERIFSELLEENESDN